MPQHSMPGIIMGTVGYMSPNRRKARLRDRSALRHLLVRLHSLRSSHWQETFRGRLSYQVVAYGRLRTGAADRGTNPSAPAELQRIVRRCLAKDADERYQSIKEVAIELKELRREMEGSAALDATVSPSMEESSQRPGDAETRSISAASTQLPL